MLDVPGNRWSQLLILLFALHLTFPITAPAGSFPTHDSATVIVAVGAAGAWRQRGYGNLRLRDALLVGLLSPLGVAVGVVAVLGAGAEMGPLQALLRWGATVAAVDLPRPEIWQRVLDAATSRE